MREEGAECSPQQQYKYIQGFSRDVVLGGGGGGIAFVGRENVKNIQKTNEICYCLGGKFPPLKALKKKH